MLKKVLWVSILMVILLAVAIGLTYYAREILFNRLRWVIVGAAVLGVALGTFSGLRQSRFSGRSDAPADRHNLDSFLEHWGTAVGIVILTVSGFFIQAQYRRGFSTNLHFTGLIVTLLFGFYFLADFLVAQKYRYLWPGIKDIFQGTLGKYLLRRPWAETGKYLASQKSAFLALIVVGSGLDWRPAPALTRSHTDHFFG